MNAADQPKGPRRFWRWTAFRLGGLLGLTAGALFCAWLYGLIIPGGPNVEVAVAGDDASLHGVARVVVRDSYGAELTQVCVEGCDDLRFWLRSGDNTFRVHAYDSRGQCVACDDGAYVTSGLKDRWTVSGRERLEVRHGSDLVTDTRP